MLKGEKQMGDKEKGSSFNRRITMVNNRPHIYIVSSSDKGEPSGEPARLKMGRGAADSLKEQTPPAVSFFGHHIGKLLASDKPEAEEFGPVDKELESSLEAVRRKLQMIRAPYAYGESRISQEEMKHQRFIEQRNRAQEALFEDIIRRHGEFVTGLGSENLWSLHDLMVMEANHEAVCSQEESVHELVECNLLTFLRRKAAEQAWQRLEGYLVQFQIPFPMSSFMEDPAEPLRNEKVREERKKSAQNEFLKMPAQQLAELILGNVPNWVYSYPQKDAYLWQLTVLQGVTAGLAANLLMKYLSIWEEHSTEILDRIQQEFMGRIDEIRQRGESATDLPEVLSVSKELQRISGEEIPDRIWKLIFSTLDAP